MILTQRVKIVFQCIIAVCGSGESYYDYIYGDFLHCTIIKGVCNTYF